MSTAKPIIVVFCGTSKQGSSVVKSLIACGKYHVKTLTTRPDAPLNKHFATLGVEVVKGDISNKAELLQILTGAYGAYLMTPSIDYENLEYSNIERAYIKAQGDACLEAGVQHIVFSTTEAPTDPAIIAEFKYLNLGSRFEMQHYLEALAIPFVSSLAPAFFYTNPIEFLNPFPGEEPGTLIFPMPCAADVKLPYTDVSTSMGPMAVAMFASPAEYNRQSIPVVSEFLTSNELVAIFEQVTGIKSHALPLNREQFLSNFGPAQQTGNMLFEIWDYTSRFTYFAKHQDTNKSRQVDPNCLTWQTFLEKTQWRGMESFADYTARTQCL
eukprot:gene16696-19849_t